MDNLQFAPVTMCMSKVTLAAGTTTTLSNTGTTTYAIRGKAYTKAAMSNVATPTTDAATGAAFTGVLANYGSVILVGFNAAGSLLAVQGSIVPLDVSGAFINAPQFPEPPLDFCPIGYIVVKAGSTANATTGFIFGTSSLATPATGITLTYVDVIGLPDRPQIA